MGASGISSGFPGLSQSLGQVAHVLRTRSPLGLPQGCPWLDPVRLACVKHAASVRPEPGSNSPSRSWTPPKRSRDQKSRSSRALTRWTNWHRNVKHYDCCPFQCIDFATAATLTSHTVARTGFWLSLFRFQGAPFVEARAYPNLGWCWCESTLARVAGHARTSSALASGVDPARPKRLFTLRLCGGDCQTWQLRPGPTLRPTRMTRSVPRLGLGA